MNINSDPRLETKISMNFIPWANLESLDQSSFMNETIDTKMKESFRIRRVKSDAAYKFKKNQINMKKSRSYNQRFPVKATEL